jgi:Family of unknown function (DUF6518)
LTTEIASPSTPASSPPSAAYLRGALAVVTGLGVGVLTSFAQGWLSGPYDALANAASPWLAFAFALGWLMRSRTGALAAGVTVCLAELAGYYLTAGARGFGVGDSSTLALWVFCAVVGGPLLALAGHEWRANTSMFRRFAPLALSACFLVEGARYSAVLHQTDTATLWFAIAVAIAALCILPAMTPPA